MVKIIWKYKIEYDLDEEELNKLGKNGWELTAAVFEQYDKSGTVFYFKKKYKYPLYVINRDGEVIEIKK